MLPPKKVLPLTMLHVLLPLELHIFKRSSARSSLLLLLWPLPLAECRQSVSVRRCRTSGVGRCGLCLRLRRCAAVLAVPQPQPPSQPTGYF
jgi:hypothetical protein